MTPPPRPKTTDQRQAQTIALAIIERLETLGGITLADEGRVLIETPPIDWPGLLDWNRRACDWLMKNREKV